MAWLRSLQKEMAQSMPWTSFQSLEVGGGSGPTHWGGVGQHGTKQYRMALQVGRKAEMADRTCVEVE